MTRTVRCARATPRPAISGGREGDRHGGSRCPGPERPDLPAFEDLGRRHNGVWGGCWCTWFHRESHSGSGGGTAEGSRDLKHRLVETGCAHAALVFDGEAAVGWAQYGSPAELPGIHHRKDNLAGVDVLPDYRITCFFTDKAYRRQGVAEVALAGALELIAEAGGGVVESYPQDTQDTRVTASFLYNGTRPMFESAGFRYLRPKGTKHCVMSITVPPAADHDPGRSAGR